MIATIANAFSVPEIRRKILFTCAILALYRSSPAVVKAAQDALRVGP